MLSRQSHRYMLKQLIELNDKKWSILSLVLFAKGFLLSIYDSRSREIVQYIPSWKPSTSKRMGKNVRCAYYNNNYFIDISLVSDNIYNEICDYKQFLYICKIKQIISRIINNDISLQFQTISEIPDNPWQDLRFLMGRSRRAGNVRGTSNRARQRQIFELICMTISSAVDPLAKPYAPISPVFSHVGSLWRNSTSGIQSSFAKADSAFLPNVTSTDTDNFCDGMFIILRSLALRARKILIVFLAKTRYKL